MKLKEKQFLFAELEAKLILRMRHLGYKPVKGYCFRCQDCPVGKKKSLHKLCLATDIELHNNDGKYLTKTEDHEQFGIWWEKQHPLCRWGGRFDDGNHYSITHGGMM
jgi:hypothetical protein